MSANGETVPQGAQEVSGEVTSAGKGKGKAVEQPDTMEEDDESEEESGPEEVCRFHFSSVPIDLVNNLHSNQNLKKTVRCPSHQFTHPSPTPTMSHKCALIALAIATPKTPIANILTPNRGRGHGRD